MPLSGANEIEEPLGEVSPGLRSNTKSSMESV
jgi:hypothetical protein